MSILLRSNPAPSGDSPLPRWTSGNKAAVGSAYSPCPVWFTLTGGVVSEVYFPRTDMPQIRDVQLLVTDGKSFFHDGWRSYDVQYETIAVGVPGYVMTCKAKGQPYQIVYEVITAANTSCLLMQTRIQVLPGAPAGFLKSLHVYVLVAPHIDGTTDRNNGYVGQTSYGKVLLANVDDKWLAVGASVPFLKCSASHSGVNDGWQDIVGQRRLMTYEYNVAENGAIALTGELDISKTQDFVLCLAFGQDAFDVAKANDLSRLRSEAPAARNALLYGLGTDFETFEKRYIKDWQTEVSTLVAPDPNVVHHQDRLYQMSRAVLLMHEDQTYDGAFVASLSIPWGENTGDHEGGGYHLVWPRDMSQTIGALFYAGEYEAALRGLRFLAVSQQNNGSLFQNFLVDGTPTGQQLQLDEVAFPILHAYRMHRAGKLVNRFDPLPFVIGCAATIVWRGPKTEGERWEEKSGYSPSTLASNIAALVCAGALIRELANNQALAIFFEEYADFLERHLEAWTTTRNGTISQSGVKHHYIRISDKEDPETAQVSGSSGQPGCAAKDMVDAGFLELVRYGIRRADDPLIVDSVKVVDEILAVNFAPDGSEPRICFHRYNHDGYGQKENGHPWKNYPGDSGDGIGGPWPLFAGERAHYEIALGGNPELYLRSFESFATQIGLFPEQVWKFDPKVVDLPDSTSLLLERSGPTGAAVPLVWAHAEYVKLIHSLEKGKVLDLIPEVKRRYIERNPAPTARVEFWTFQRKDDPVKVRRGQVIRIPADRPFQFRWTNDAWQNVNDLQSTPSVVDRIHVLELDTTPLVGPQIDFTFYWPTDGRWEGRNFVILVEP
jgi:glucoamylase